MAKKNGTLSYRVEQLEKSVEDLEKKIDEIRTNHLVHIQLELMAIKTRQNVMTAIQVGAIILALVVQKVFLT